MKSLVCKQRIFKEFIRKIMNFSLSALLRGLKVAQAAQGGNRAAVPGSVQKP